MLTIATLPVITTTSLPPGLPGVAYSQTIAATGGLAPYSFFVLPTGTSNPLPPGITLAKSGLLAGTPTTPGAYSFTVQVVDSKPEFRDQNFPAHHWRCNTILRRLASIAAVLGPFRRRRARSTKHSDFQCGRIRRLYCSG